MLAGRQSARRQHGTIDAALSRAHSPWMTRPTSSRLARPFATKVDWIRSADGHAEGWGVESNESLQDAPLIPPLEALDFSCV